MHDKDSELTAFKFFMAPKDWLEQGEWFKVHNEMDLASFYCWGMICEQALISALQSLPRFVSEGGYLRTTGHLLGCTLVTFSQRDKCQLLGAFRANKYHWCCPECQNQRECVQRALVQQVSGLQIFGLVQSVSGATPRFPCRVMMNITTGESSRFGMPWS